MSKTRGRDAFSIFILPPSIEELEHRIRGRKTESEEKIQQRLERAKVEITQAGEYDYQVVNGDLDKALMKSKRLF